MRSRVDRGEKRGGEGKKNKWRGGKSRARGGEEKEGLDFAHPCKNSCLRSPHY